MKISFDKFEATHKTQFLDDLRKRAFDHYPELDLETKQQLFDFCLWDCDRLLITSEQGIEAHVLASFHMGEPISNCPGFDDMQAHHSYYSGSPDVVPIAFLEKMQRHADIA